jgi:adenosylcobinamide-GDP ribazoletransferase
MTSEPDGTPMPFLAREFSIFLLAVQFLTRAPVPTDVGFTAERMAETPRYYPLVGALVGALGAGVYFLANMVWPGLIAVLAAMTATLLITGAFHEDGLADTFDGVGGAYTRTRALQIMKDSRIGVYGAAALAMALAMKAAALVSFEAAIAPLALIVGHGLSRASAVVAIGTSAYVRAEGTAKPTAEGVSSVAFAVAGLCAVGLLAMVALAVDPAASAAGLAGLAAGHLGMRLFYERKLGGYTGDCLGAVQQASEIGFYLGLLAWL